MKTTLIASAIAATVAAGAIAASTTPASAEVVCNRYHECWTVHQHVVYPAAARVIYHDDSWRAAHARNWRWREERAAERGYYRNGIWIKF